MQIEYHDWPRLTANQTLYAYHCNAERTTYPEKATIGPIHEVFTQAVSGGTIYAYRKKQDGTFYKKETCRWVNRFFTSKHEAEQDRLEQVEKLRKRIQAKIDECKTAIDNL